MKHMFFCMAAYVAVLCSCSRAGDNVLLEKLDNVLGQKETYQGYFRDRMQVLRVKCKSCLAILISSTLSFYKYSIRI